MQDSEEIDLHDEDDSNEDDDERENDIPADNIGYDSEENEVEYVKDDEGRKIQYFYNLFRCFIDIL